MHHFPLWVWLPLGIAHSSSVLPRLLKRMETWKVAQPPSPKSRTCGSWSLQGAVVDEVFKLSMTLVQYTTVSWPSSSSTSVIRTYLVASNGTWERTSLLRPSILWKRLCTGMALRGSPLCLTIPARKTLTTSLCTWLTLRYRGTFENLRSRFGCLVSHGLFKSYFLRSAEGETWQDWADREVFTFMYFDVIRQGPFGNRRTLGPGCSAPKP